MCVLWKLLQVQKKFNKELQDKIELIFTAEIENVWWLIWKGFWLVFKEGLAFQLVLDLYFMSFEKTSKLLWVFVTCIELWWMLIGRHCPLSKFEVFWSFSLISDPFFCFRKNFFRAKFILKFRLFIFVTEISKSKFLTPPPIRAIPQYQEVISKIHFRVVAGHDDQWESCWEFYSE